MQVKSQLTEQEQYVQQLHSLVQENQQKQVASAGLSEIERNELIAETETRTINSMAVEIQEALIAELTPMLEQEIRAQVEQELWHQFEQEWKNRSTGNLA